MLTGCGPAPASFHHTNLTGASFARGFSLIDHDGRPRALADFQGRVVIVFFGYTTCPDICPTMLTQLAQVMQMLGPDAARVQVLFITLDPERDSGERLKAFVPWFHPDFLGLRGEPAQIRAVADEFRVRAVRKPVEGELGDVIDHSTGAYVFDPTGRLRLYLQDSARVDDIVADLQLLLKA
jgi:protein SCO1/2